MEGPIIDQGVIRNDCPVDLHMLPPIKASIPREVQETIAKARAAQPVWEALGFDERARLMKLAGKRMLERRQECLEHLHDEIGKTPAEALLSEAVGPLQYISDWTRVARPWLKPRRLAINPLAFPRKKGMIEMLPRGVIGVIAPWNFPLGNFFKPVFPALLCGNSVVIKPSEYSPRTAEWFVGIMNEFLPAGVLGIVQGDKEIGQCLVRSGIDAVTFTGSFRSGREVARLAGEQMIPCSAELGGKDAAIVLSDCEMDRTVASIMYWALHNGGQACGAIERVYVEEGIASEFTSCLAKAVSRLRVSSGDPQTSDVSPCANPAQLSIVEEHVYDAVLHGAKILCGGKRTGKGLWFEPTVLDRCTTAMRVMREPTFGPIISIVHVKNADEAIRLANHCDYGLNASVWSKNIRRATEIARKLQVGTAYVNNHAFTGAMPSAPWTGVKQSGYGIANSAFALQHYTRPRTLVVDRKKSADGWWFPMDEVAEELGHRLAEAQLGKVRSALKVPFLMAKRQKIVMDFVRTGKKISARNDVDHSGGDNLRRYKRRNFSFKTFFARFTLPLTAIELAWGCSAIESAFSDAGTGYLPLLPRKDAESFLKDLYGSMPFPGNLTMRAIFWIVGLSPIFKFRRLMTIDRLSPEERLAVLQGFVKSKSYVMRQAAILLKMNGALMHTSTSRFQKILAERASTRKIPFQEIRPEF